MPRARGCDPNKARERIEPVAKGACRSLANASSYWRSHND
jgi:hypothetical protein